MPASCPLHPKKPGVGRYVCACVCLSLLHYSVPAVGGLCLWFLFPSTLDSTVHSVVVSCVCVHLCVFMHPCVSVTPHFSRCAYMHIQRFSFKKSTQNRLSYVTWVFSRKLFCLPKALGVISCTCPQSEFVKLMWSFPCTHCQMWPALNYFHSGAKIL